MKITKPTFVVDKKKVFRNIRRIKEKLAPGTGKEAIRFRPHFKTHQSEEVGQWFRQLGVTGITVSSLEMAAYFARRGWRDITVAVIVNPCEIETINQLMEKGELKLNLLVDSSEVIQLLDRQLQQNLDCWLKIDTGYHRTGIPFENRELLLKTASMITESSKLNLKGVLTHAGHSYDANSLDEIKQLYQDTVSKLQYIRDFLMQAGFPGLEISYGDTPTITAMEKFDGIDEIRPGNFVYYDVMQLELGVCSEDDIAAAAMCPVIGRYPERNEVVVYGGAVHLSKEKGKNAQGQSHYGLVAPPNESFQQWGSSLKETFVRSLSQEHGIIKTTAAQIEHIKIGDILAILPIHSCLTSNLLRTR